MNKSTRNNLLLFLLLAVIYFSPLRGFIARNLSEIKVKSGLKLDLNEEINPKEINSMRFSLLDIKGESAELEDYKGKVVFINFWATWCPPCLAEMPSLEDLYKKYEENSDIVFLFVASPPENDLANLKQFLQSKGYTLPVFIANQRTPEELQTSTIPKTFILNKKAEIVLEEGSSRDWNTADVHQLLDKLLAE